MGIHEIGKYGVLFTFMYIDTINQIVRDGLSVLCVNVMLH